MNIQTGTVGFSEAYVAVNAPFTPEPYLIEAGDGAQFMLGVRATVGEDPARLDVTPVVIEAGKPRFGGAAADEEGFQEDLPYQISIGNTGLRGTVIAAQRYPNPGEAPPHSPQVAMDAAAELCEQKGVPPFRPPAGVFGPTIAVPPQYRQVSIEHGDSTLRFPNVAVGNLALAAVQSSLAVIRHYPDGTVREYSVNQPIHAY